MNAVARWISIIFHPLVTMFVLVAAAVLRAYYGAESLRIIAVAAVIAFLPVSLLMAFALRTGRWQNVDASQPSERKLLFSIALIVVGFLAVVLRLWLPATFLARGTFAAGALIATAWALLRRIKVSLHVAFTAYAGAVMLVINEPAGVALLIAVPLVAWARLRMTRHTFAEVFAGALIGAAAGAFFLAG